MIQSPAIIEQIGIVSAGASPADTRARRGCAPARAVGAALPALAALELACLTCEAPRGLRARAHPPTPARDMQSPLGETGVGIFEGVRPIVGLGDGLYRGRGCDHA